MNYYALQAISNKMGSSLPLSEPEEQQWSAFLDQHIFEIRCKQAAREPLNEKENKFWELYLIANPDRIKEALTEENLREFGRYVQLSRESSEQFIREFIQGLKDVGNAPG